LAGHEGIAGVTFRSDGHRLVGVAYLARGDEPKPTALLLHGCPGLEHNRDLAAALRDRGWNALLFHYRGCWGSGGPYDVRTIGRDIAAAVDYLQSGAHPSVDPGRLAVVGHSLGGWAAVLAAAGDQRLRAVAVYGTAIDLSGTAADLAGTRLSDGQIDREFTRFLATTPAEFRSHCEGLPRPRDVVASIGPRPLLVVHGSADEWVPVALARQLHARAREPRRYVEVEGANHAFSWHRAMLVDLITGWLDQSLDRSPDQASAGGGRR
jgi:pimeloyl-ACP methyl ester carboxylesterase